MIAAIIDLGTNTSNLVVASLQKPHPEFLYQGKEYVRLGDARIVENEISDEAMERALAVLERQTNLARQFRAGIIRIVATSAVRQAINREDFLVSVKARTGIDTEVVDGEREATLIYYGVRLALRTFSQPAAILDIGGGSNEIIVCENGTMNWKGSFAAGMSRIINSFPISDPLTPSEADTLSSHFRVVHHDALQKCREFGVKTLIGCSGAFNTMADVLEQTQPEEVFRTAREISLSEFDLVYRYLVPTTHETRKTIRGMDPMRTDLIVPALILSRTFIDHTPVSRIVQTGYSLREGVLYEMMKGKEHEM